MVNDSGFQVMRLTLKLTAAIMFAMAILLLIHGFLVVRREIALFNKDLERHARLVGGIITSSAEDILQVGGEERMSEIVSSMNKVEKLLRIRLVHLDSIRSNIPESNLKTADIEKLLRGQKLLFNGKGSDNRDYLFAYFPIYDGAKVIAAVEVSESLDIMYNYTKQTIIRKVILFLAIVMTGSIIVIWLGARLVGNPVNQMVGLANRVSEGKFDQHVDIKNRGDEMAALAAGLNEMVVRLDRARRSLEDETAKKLATMEQLHHAERLATVGKLASGLAHELGTPLNVVSGRAKMISSEELNDREILDCANIIREQTVKMTNIIRQLLDFARTRKPSKEPADLSALVQRVFSLLGPMASDKGITFGLEHEKTLSPIKVDPGQIQQVLSNLIVNSIHAMPDGGQIKVRIQKQKAAPPPGSGGKGGDYYRLDIIDQGIGIPRENMRKIFTPFFSTKDVGDGTGLGLSISHGIIREHKGWIEVDSEPGKGSVFSIYLPLEGDHE